MQIRAIATSIIMAILMVSAAVSADRLKPRLYLADTRPGFKVELLIPKEFKDWKLLPSAVGVVNPQATALSDKIYAEVVSRTYVSSANEVIMLSIAYGRDQRDSNQVHAPEICYPAQGYMVDDITAGAIQLPWGEIPVRRVNTRLESQRRPEPVTYWTTLGDYPVTLGNAKKFKEMEYALHGYIADGLLFRVSSINAKPEQGYQLQDRFVQDLLESVTPEARLRLAGLPR